MHMDPTFRETLKTLRNATIMYLTDQILSYVSEAMRKWFFDHCLPQELYVYGKLLAQQFSKVHRSISI